MSVSHSGRRVVELDSVLVQGLRNGLGILEMRIDALDPKTEWCESELQYMHELVHQMEEAFDSVGVRFTYTGEDDDAGVPVMPRAGDCDACGTRAVWGIETVDVDHEDGTPTSLEICPGCRGDSARVAVAFDKQEGSR